MIYEVYLKIIFRYFMQRYSLAEEIKVSISVSLPATRFYFRINLIF